MLRHDRNMADRGVWKQVPGVPKNDRAEPFRYDAEKVPQRDHGEVPETGSDQEFQWENQVV